MQELNDTELKDFWEFLRKANIGRGGKIARSSTTIASLPQEILQLIFNSLEPQFRKSVVCLVCKEWKQLEGTLPQRPSKFEYSQRNPRGRAALRWLMQEAVDTSRLQTVSIECKYGWQAAEQKTDICAHFLLTLLAVRLSPVTSLDINNYRSQPGNELLGELVRLTALKQLTICGWQYGSSDIPMVAGLSSLQQLQDLTLHNVGPTKEYMVDQSSRSSPYFRHALQSLTALTKLVINHGCIGCPPFHTTEIEPICT